MLSAKKDIYFSWLREKAIPLWSTKGFDEKTSLFHERLSFDATPCDPSILRLMPQMRQVASFAYISTWSQFSADERREYLALARSAFKEVSKLYKSPDNKPGWIYGLDIKTKETQPERDLYTHAFVLFAHARLGMAEAVASDKDQFNILRDQAMAECVSIKEIFQLTFLDKIDDKREIEAVPYQGGHAQNPYMHLFESLMELFKTFRDPTYLMWAHRLLDFVLPKITGTKNLIVEHFDNSWVPKEPSGKNIVEPGHLFEWSSLLNKYAEIDQTIPVKKLTEHFCSFGFKNGTCKRRSLVWSGVQESGKNKIQTARLWPQTEFLRWAATQEHLDPAVEKFADKVSQKLFKTWFRTDLNGGWVDSVDQDSVAVSTWMPATSFYHVLGLISEVVLRD